MNIELLLSLKSFDSILHGFLMVQNKSHRKRCNECYLTEWLICAKFCIANFGLNRLIDVSLICFFIHRMICTLSYFTLILYIAQTAGNPFLNFFIQSAAEAPAFFLGTYMGKFIGKLHLNDDSWFDFNYLANKLGRRWTNSISFVMAAIFCIPTALLANRKF